MNDVPRPATSTVVSPRAALRWSWTRFRETPAVLAGATALWLLVLVWVVVALQWAEDLLTGHLNHRALEAAAGGDYMAAVSRISGSSIRRPTSNNSSSSSRRPSSPRARCMACW